MTNPDPNTAKKQTTARRMRQQADNIGFVAEQLKGELTEDETTNRFNQFLENVEKGWTNFTVEADEDQPYNRPYENRPRIRNLTKNTSAKPG